MDMEIRIIGGRIAKLRRDKGIDQRMLAEILTDEVQANVTIPLISAWETGRRPVPKKYYDTLCRTFECTLCYLQGLTNDPCSDTPQEEIKDPGGDCAEEIRRSELVFYDGKPVFIEFIDFSHVSQWGIYNDCKKEFVTKIGAVKIQPSMRFYAYMPDYEIESKRARRALDLAQVLKVRKVFVLMASPDDTIRKMYNGWYIHNENHSALLNPWNGLVLPYEGINVSYKAYSIGDPTKQP